MDKVLIDSDVILDFFFDRKPHSEFATEVLSLCDIKEIGGFITPVMINNIYYLLRRVDIHENVIPKLISLIELIDILAMDKKIVKSALKSDFKDFEDALQNFTAQSKENVKIILTRNLKDYRSSNLIILTPEQYLKNRLAL